MHIIDSLGKKYNKKVIGFSRAVTINPDCQETFIIFYTVNGEMYDEIVWSKELLDNNQTNQIIIITNPIIYDLDESDKTKKNSDDISIIIIIKKVTYNKTTTPFYVYNYYGSGALIGFINNRKFIKIKPEEYKFYVVPLWAQKILENDTELNMLLKQKYGGYILL